MHNASDDTRPIRVPLADSAATEALGAALLPLLAPGWVIWLEGDLGAGKTTLTRGLLRAAGHTGSVKSPTYTLIEVYTVSRIALYHFDFYRFTNADEFIDAGLDEYFGGDGVCLVEWAEKALPHVPAPDIEVRLQITGESRLATLQSRSRRGGACLSAIALPL